MRTTTDPNLGAIGLLDQCEDLRNALNAGRIGLDWTGIVGTMTILGTISQHLVHAGIALDQICRVIHDISNPQVNDYLIVRWNIPRSRVRKGIHFQSLKNVAHNLQLLFPSLFSVATFDPVLSGNGSIAKIGRIDRLAAQIAESDAISQSVEWPSHSVGLENILALFLAMRALLNPLVRWIPPGANGSCTCKVGTVCLVSIETTCTCTHTYTCIVNETPFHGFEDFKIKPNGNVTETENQNPCAESGDLEAVASTARCHEGNRQLRYLYQ